LPKEVAGGGGEIRSMKKGGKMKGKGKRLLEEKFQG